MSTLAQRLVAAAWLFAGALFWAGVTVGVAIQLVRELTRSAQRTAAPEPVSNVTLAGRIAERTLGALGTLPARFVTDDLATAALDWEAKADSAAVRSEVAAERGRGGARSRRSEVAAEEGVEEDAGACALADVVHIIVAPDDVEHAPAVGTWHLIRPTPGTCWREMKEVWN